MFKENTLFILGAGASYPFGYPLGKDLITLILEDMEDEVFIPRYTKPQSPLFWNQNDQRLDHHYEFSEIEIKYKDLKNFYNELEQSNFRSYQEDTFFIEYQTNFALRYHQAHFRKQIQNIDIFNYLKEAIISFDPISIDAFIRDNPSFAKAGKIMILYSLLKRENPDKFNVPKNYKSDANNWYSLLLNDMVSGCADDPNKLLSNNVKFVTFNYDVSLDFYLHSRLNRIEIFNNKGAENNTIAQNFIANLSITHIYGKLYDLNTQLYGYYYDIYGKQSSQKTIAPPTNYSILNFKRFIYGCFNFNNILTMYDERQEAESYKKAVASNRSLIEWADEIIIIGFGFDRDNLNILGIPDSLSGYKSLITKPKTIRYMNYKGYMKALAQEFKYLEEKINSYNPINVIESQNEYITSAYLNDFKKYLIL